MTRNTWIIFTAVVFILFGGLIFLSSKDRIDVSTVNENSILAADEQSGNIGDHTRGNTKSKVVLVEYGDYQCPGCKAAHEPLKTVSEKYEDQMVFIFRNFPLTNAHPNARAAAAAAEAADKLGKFWEMHDKLYEAQDEWSGVSSEERTALFTSYAIQVGLDEPKFTAALKEHNESINKKISFDIALGRKIGVDGTPGIYLNGKKIDQRIRDGKIIDGSQSSNNDSSVWADAEAFDELILQPAFKDAGIDVSKLNAKN